MSLFHRGLHATALLLAATLGWFLLQPAAGRLPTSAGPVPSAFSTVGRTLPAVASDDPRNTQDLADGEDDERAGDDPTGASGREPGRRTLGGTQFWTDVRIDGGWRIQRNAVIGHYRLLDGENGHVVSGSFRETLEALERARNAGDVPETGPRLIMLLHGLGRSRRSMDELGEYLAEETDSDVMAFGYASTQGRVAQHSEAFRHVLSGLDARITRIDLVAHSLGNIVIRHYLGRGEPDERLRHIVMLAPPNQGAQRARAVLENDVAGAVLGPAAWELGPGWDGLEPQLAVPAVPFGIIAGRGGGKGRLEGPHDGKVTVDETRLAGAADFLIVDGLPLPLIDHHMYLMNQTIVREAVLQFLDEGHFRGEDQRQPILPEPSSPEPPPAPA